MSKTLSSAEALQTELNVMKRTTGVCRAIEKDVQMLIDRAQSNGDEKTHRALCDAARYILQGHA